MCERNCNIQEGSLGLPRRGNHDNMAYNLAVPKPLSSIHGRVEIRQRTHSDMDA